MKVLIAEDDAVLQMSVGRLMNMWGFDYDLACNGIKGIKRT